MRHGLHLYGEANKHYEKSMGVFNSANVNMINQNVKENVFISLQDLSDILIKPGRPENLEFWLKAITPSKQKIVTLKEIPSSVYAEIANAARTATNPASEVNALLDRHAIEKATIDRLPEWIDKVDPSDYIREATIKDFGEMIDVFASDAFAQNAPEVIRHSMRDMLARQWLDDTARMARGPTGEFSGPRFAQAFHALDTVGETRMQSTLFGTQNAARMRELAQDFTLAGKKGPEFAEQVLSDINTIEARSIVENLQKTLKIADEQSQNALFRAIRNGEIDDADALVMAVLKNPRSISQLRNALGKDATDLLDKPGGLQDMVMQRIMLTAFPDGVTPDAVASGAFGKTMRKTISKMNANGALAKVLTKPDRAGQETVNDLLKVARMAERVSDASLPETGLAPAGFMAAAMLRLLTAPMAFLGEAAGIMAIGRMMRSTPLLKFLTSPQLSSRETRQAIKAGLEGLDTRNLTMLELTEMRNQVIRAILSLQTGEGITEGVVEPVTEVVEEVTEQIQPAIGAATGQIQPAIDALTGQIQPAIGAATGQRPMAPQPSQTPVPPASDVLERIEMEKLVGMR